MISNDELQPPRWTVYNVAQGLLTYRGKVLLVGNDYGGPNLVWSLPGEQAAEAVVREVQEETSLRVVAGDLLYTVDARTARDYRHYLTFVFGVSLPVAPAVEPPVSYGQDQAVRAVRWVRFEEVPTLIERPSLGEGLVNYLYYGPARLPRRYWCYPEYWSPEWSPLSWPPKLA